MNGKIDVLTSSRIDVVNVTGPLAQLVAEMGDGLALLYAPHTTVALLLSEDDDALREDLMRVAAGLLADLRPFRHVRNNNPNAEAHLLSALGGSSLVVPVTRGKMDLGTFQNILLLELDGPKQREIRCMTVATVGHSSRDSESGR